MHRLAPVHATSRPRFAAGSPLVVGILVLALAGCGVAAPQSQSVGSPESLQNTLVRANLDRPGDPELVGLYNEINSGHFQNLLPAMPVRWESRLSEVDLHQPDGLKLLGTYGKVGSKSVILLRPSLQNDPDDLARALAHEMVHAYLMTTLGDEDTHHGASYQAVLRRLALEGAFKGIPSTPDERDRLRAWLDQERPKLDSDSAVAAFNREVERYNLMLVYPDGITKASQNK